jgi:hypothetical protein
MFENEGCLVIGFRDTIAICLVTWFTSIFSGFAIFTVLGKKLLLIVWV